MKTIKILLLICLLSALFTSCKVSNSNNETETVSYFIPTFETTTLSYELIDDVVTISSISFHISQSFEVESKSEGVLLKSKENTLEVSFEDVTDLVTDFDKYIRETVDYFRQVGLSPSDVEETNIRNYTAQRFAINTFDLTSSDVKIFCYFIEMNECNFVVSVVSKDEEIITAEQADEFLETIDFI